MGNIKVITSYEPIAVERKGKDVMTIHPHLTHISAFNRMPSIAEKENGFFDRLVKIDFPYTFGNADQVASGEKDKLEDINLKDDIVNNELDLIVTWAMQGLFRLMDNGYIMTTNAKMKTDKEAYRQSVDSTRGWANIILEPIKNATNLDYISGAKLRKQYEMWCFSNGIDKPMGRNHFMDSLKRAFKGYWKSIHDQPHFAVRHKQ